MGTLIEISDDEVEALDELARRECASRETLIRAAISEYLLRRGWRPAHNAFGLWGNGVVDGLAYQEQVREEEW